MRMRLCLHLATQALLAFNLVVAGDLTRDVPAKYFSTSPHSSYLDGRFAQAERLSTREMHEALVKSVRCFLSAMKEIRVTVWLAHGTLLGWYWGKKMLPWDTNIDVHIHYDDLRFLAAYHNMTLYKDGPSSAKYLLDINPSFFERSRAKDPDNIIDAKWIDMATGLSVDITAVSEMQQGFEEGAQYLLAKDGHNYRKDAVIPLRVSKFERAEVYIPRNVSALLAHEYGQDSLERTVFQGYTFDAETNQWKVIRPTATGW